MCGAYIFLFHSSPSSVVGSSRSREPPPPSPPMVYCSGSLGKLNCRQRVCCAREYFINFVPSPKSTRAGRRRHKLSPLSPRSLTTNDLCVCVCVCVCHFPNNPRSVKSRKHTREIIKKKTRTGKRRFDLFLVFLPE